MKKNLRFPYQEALNTEAVWYRLRSANRHCGAERPYI